ncbi:MAG TPA: IS110 family transposase [Pyrinomonadaceae bacterium]|nr:IS110 family transposase [Pyrinomonadaceae bacterium]
MTVYIGVDFHARQQTISYLTTEDGEIQQLVLLHEDPAKVRAFYEQFAGQRVVVGFESSGYAAWFEELLEELGCEIWIGHATYIRQFAKRRQKNDRRDADLILELLMSGDFPRIHRYSRSTRQVLQQLRYRQRLVKMRTMIVNMLLFMAGSRGHSFRTQLQSKRGQARLAQLPLPEPLGQQRDELLSLLAQLDQKIKTIEGWLEQTATADVAVQRLRTHPGIGLLTSICVRYTLEDVGRFATTRKVSAFAGFDPMEDRSAERRRMGAISKQGSRWLRFFLVEAGQVAMRRDADLARVYQRVSRRGGHAKAKVAVGRRLLVRAFIMLRDGIDYAEFCRRGVAARSSRGSA